MADRNPHELSSDLLPVSSSWLAGGTSGSSEDLMEDVDRVGLAVAPGYLSESGSSGTICKRRPSVSSRRFVGAAKSHVDLTISAQTGSMTVQPSRNLGHLHGLALELRRVNILPAVSFPIQGINVLSDLDRSCGGGDPKPASVSAVDGGVCYCVHILPTGPLVVHLIHDSRSERDFLTIGGPDEAIPAHGHVSKSVAETRPVISHHHFWSYSSSEESFSVVLVDSNNL